MFIFAGNGGQREVRLQGLQEQGQYRISRRLGGEEKSVRGTGLMAEGLAVGLAAGEGSLWRIDLQ